MTIIDRETRVVPVEQYHSDSAVNSGMIRCFAIDGPWDCYHRFVTRTVKAKDSDEKRLGRAFHAAMQDPDRWLDGFVLLPQFVLGEELNRRKPSHREFLAKMEFDAFATGKDFISEEDLEPLRLMVDSVYNNPATRPYVGHGFPVELAGWGKHLETGLSVRGLADVYDAASSTIIDFKTTRHSTANEFIRDALQKGYDYQGAHYLDVFDCKNFIIIAIRNSPPFEAMVYRVPQHRIDKAKRKNEAVIRSIAACFEFNDWHSLQWGQEVELSLSEDPLTGVTRY